MKNNKDKTRLELIEIIEIIEKRWDKKTSHRTYLQKNKYFFYNGEKDHAGKRKEQRYCITMQCLLWNFKYETKSSKPLEEIKTKIQKDFDEIDNASSHKDFLPRAYKDFKKEVFTVLDIPLDNLSGSLTESLSSTEPCSSEDDVEFINEKNNNQRSSLLCDEKLDDNSNSKKFRFGY